MGYWPAKLTAFLNIILTVGYGVTACIIAGQILSAGSGGSMSIVVGVVITALISWLVTVFGMALFQTYQRYEHCSSKGRIIRSLNTNGEQMGLDPAIDCPNDISRYRGS